MKKKYIVLLVFCFVINSYTIFAQKKGGSSAPNIGVGVRLGDPSGISVKKYMGENALELSIGRSQMFYRGGWYDKRFHHWYEKENFGYRDFDYIGYKVSTPIGIQLNYLFQKDINGIDNLQWYWGLGAQLRHQSYSFDYRYRIYGDNDWYYATGQKVTDIDLGADAVIGLEYTFSDIPLSIFGDAVLFMEVADNPFVFWFQGGIGLRYNF